MNEYTERMNRMRYLSDWRAYEARQKASIPWDALDENIIPLVKALNAIPGCITLACCGGHTDGSGSCPSGEFIVGMLFTQDEVGWSALWEITYAINMVGPGVSLTPAENDNLLIFWLRGKGVRDDMVHWLEYDHDVGEEEGEVWEHCLMGLPDLIADEEYCQIAAKN